MLPHFVVVVHDEDEKRAGDRGVEDAGRGEKTRDHSQQVREQHEEKRPDQKRKVLFCLLPGAEHALYRGEEKLGPHELVEDALDFVRTNYPMDWRS